MEATEAQTLQYLASTHTNTSSNSSSSSSINYNDFTATIAANCDTGTTSTDIRLLDVTKFNNTREKAVNSSITVEPDTSEVDINTTATTTNANATTNANTTTADVVVSNLPTSNTTNTNTGTTNTATTPPTYCDAVTQDSPHTLPTIHNHLANLHRNSIINNTVGTSITTLQQQQQQHNQELNELNIIQLKERNQQYIQTLRPIQRDVEKDEILYNYMKELNT